MVDPATRGLRPVVTAANGQVTVAATVNSDELHDRVIETVSGVPGVRGVIDELLVVRIPRGYPAM